ncbi:TPA: hypothetical protein ACK3Q6_001583 [Burkholderia cepacia]|uniref:hypothetical protein n=1 Tax=Burkholderia cepacia TaxID=292 RepID=UPI001CF2C246|nr:hypothetical protein [Burkholderia cepacia]MCA8361664.1 hypothetical protein [Burkholderia cepacia]HDR9760981.1 hypothetical protein [Burkholderia cepacia ATCC 25416]HDV6364630.1 hypothetical protein [Burkholderia cepacia]
MRAALVLAACLALGGCDSLRYAGIARYEVSPFVNEAGDPVGCCVLRVWNGKQMATVEATFMHQSDNSYSISLRETDVEAFAGQATAAAAASDVVGAATSAAVTAIKTLK